MDSIFNLVKVRKKVKENQGGASLKNLSCKLSRFCLPICASFFMLSAFSCNVSSMETEESFLIRFLSNVTQKFKDNCVDAVERNAAHTELRERLFEFAKEGESSAAHTL